MPARHLPVRPDLTHLKHQAKDLLRAFRAGDSSAVADFREYHPDRPEPAGTKLADAQLVLARSYEAPSWPRLVLAINLIDAIWEDDIDAVRELVTRHPNLIHENTGVRKNYNWGRPMSYAANLGRDRIIQMLHQLGAKDLGYAIDRATLQSQIGTARMLHAMMGAPRPPADSLGGPAYTLSSSGTALLFELGARVFDESGKLIAPVAVVLETDSRNPEAKHAILEMYAQHGVVFPDTAVMALHRGRIDLLQDHLDRDPALLHRTFPHREIFPPDLDCHDEWLPRTSLSGATLLHLCVEFAELEIARWLLDHGMDVDAPAAVSADGFGGHTALFNSVVSFPNFWANRAGGDSPFARLLLDHGANPNARASLLEEVRDGERQSIRAHHNLTPIAWGNAFQNKLVVSAPAIELIAMAGGHP